MKFLEVDIYYYLDLSRERTDFSILSLHYEDIRCDFNSYPQEIKIHYYFYSCEWFTSPLTAGLSLESQ